MKTPIISILFIFLISCTQTAVKDRAQFQTNHKSTKPEIQDYINAINKHVSVNTDSVQIGKNKVSKMLFDFVDSTHVFSIWFEGSKDTIRFNATTLEFYEEEDFTGDGINEIGILPEWDASSCRIYSLFDVSGGKWKQLAYSESHLPDREKGVDYFILKNGKLSVLTSGGCCCQCECLEVQGQ